MAHFAQLDHDNKVTQVIVVSNDDCGGGDFPESEPIGQAFIASLGLPGVWMQTSYSASFRYNYAGIHYTYSATDDAFIAPQPFPSWSLDESFQWVPPIPYPTDDGWYYWNELTQTWESSNEVQ
jgi:hypothetical protein